MTAVSKDATDVKSSSDSGAPENRGDNAADRLFYVVGGEYTDTDFRILVEGTRQRHGPMPRDEAFDLWRGLSMHSIDACMVRFSIEPADR